MNIGERNAISPNAGFRWRDFLLLDLKNVHLRTFFHLFNPHQKIPEGERKKSAKECEEMRKITPSCYSEEKEKRTQKRSKK